MKQVMALGLVLAGWLAVVAPLQALAAPGAPLADAMKVARSEKKIVMGVTYYVQKGKVLGESWSSELAGWDTKVSDRLRLRVVGKRKLKPKAKGAKPYIFDYTDGTMVRYNQRHGVTITMDVYGPGFSPKVVADGKAQTVADWKENPWQGKPWK